MNDNTTSVGSLQERGMGVPFERIRRITGYLVGTLDRFNNAKAHEEHDRVKHGTSYMDKVDADVESEAVCSRVAV